MSNQSTAKAFSFEIVITLLITVIIAFYFAFPRAGQAEVETADSLSQKVMTLYHAGKYQAAFPIAKKVLRIREKTQGPDHYDVAVSLQTLAGLYEAVGDFSKAQSFDKRALKILEKDLEPEIQPAT
jgi:tetratricopeptide (TPR) repeat protein